MSDDEKIRIDDKRKFDEKGNLKGDKSLKGSVKESKKTEDQKKDKKKVTTSGAKKSVKEEKPKEKKEKAAEKKGLKEEKKDVEKRTEKSRTEEAKEKKIPEEEKREKKQAKPEEERPPVDFIHFVLSLYTSAMISLGEIYDPATGKKAENYDMAKELIDIIIMLRDKTKGNLSEEESKTLDELIFQARMIYLKATDRIKI